MEKQISKLQKLEEKQKRLEEKIKKYKRESKIEYFKEKNLERRKRAYKLIKLGALFEICNLLEEDHKSLLGYLSKYKTLSEADKKNLSALGDKILSNRKNNSATKKRNKKISKEQVNIAQIKNLIKLAKENDIDIVFEMQKKFNKKLLENLNLDEYNLLFELVNKKQFHNI